MLGPFERSGLQMCLVFEAEAYFLTMVVGVVLPDEDTYLGYDNLSYPRYPIKDMTPTIKDILRSINISVDLVSPVDRHERTRPEAQAVDHEDSHSTIRRPKGTVYKRSSLK